MAISTWAVGGLALRGNGTFVGWGAASQGQAGDGKSGFYVSPVEASAVPAGATVVAVRGGGNHVLLLHSDGTVLGWGSNGSGQIGDGSTTGRLAPVQVFAAGSDVVAIAPSTMRGTHSLALKADGTVLAWGSSSNGELGDGTVYSTGLTPAPVMVAK
jgi:alpha-tubulin suppressor-like RCC1 family protein